MGVLCLEDLWRRPQGGGTRLEEILRAAGVTPDKETCSSPHPPTDLVMLCTLEYCGILWRYQLWLSQCQRLRLVLELPASEIWEDPELRELFGEELADALGDLVIEETRYVPDLAAPEVGEWLATLLQTRSESPGPEELGPTLVPDPLPFGPWCAVPEFRKYEDAETYWPPLACVRKGEPSIYLPSSRTFLSLRTGEQSDPVCEREEFCVGVWPDGSRLLYGAPYSPPTFVHDLGTGEIARQNALSGQPIGVWPDSAYAWVGARCRYGWLYQKGGQVGALIGCEHDPPCGHEKKQYGFLDNFPCWIHLSRREDAYLSVYQKDAIVSSSVPHQWNSCDNGWVYVHRENSDPTRALFFIYEGRWIDTDPTDPLACDARDERPVIALGPSAEARYALDLSRPVYRLNNEGSVLVHEPEVSYGVYDAHHHLVRISPGRLLGGWDVYLTVLRDGHLYRDHTLTGGSEELGEVGGPVDWAFSLPRTPNVILVAGKEGATRMRLI